MEYFTKTSFNSGFSVGLKEVKVDNENEERNPERKILRVLT